MFDIPETLLRSKAECPKPPEGMNAAADAAVLREVVGVVRSIKIDPKRGGGKRKGKDGEVAAVRSTSFVGCSIH